MREGWTYKKLGEVCDLYQPKTISSDMLVSDGDYLVYGANGIIGRYNQYNHEDSEVLVTCRGATCGTINISAPFSWINGNAMVVHPKNEDLSKKYLVYALRGINMSDVINGAAQPQITRQSLSPKKFPVPPFSEQQRIVSELDLLSSIIEKKKAQLKEYDQLAQSIFYDMFGEEKAIKCNWEKCRVGDIYRFQYGKGNNIPEDKGDYPCYGSNGVVGHHITFNSEDAPIIGHIGAYAGIVNWGKGKHYVTYNGVICKLIDDCNNPVYGYYMLKSQDYLTMAKRGGAQPFVSYDLLEEPTTYIPPLSLQQSFAEKIEAIEKQKELIMQSLTEMESLYNSRIDFWFNY